MSLDLPAMMANAAHDAPPARAANCDGCTHLRLGRHVGHAGNISTTARCDAVELGRLIHWQWRRADPVPHFCPKGRA